MTGRLDYVNVTAAGYHNIWRAIEPSDEPDGYLVELTAEVKAGSSGCPSSRSAASRIPCSPSRSSPRARRTWSR